MKSEFNYFLIKKMLFHDTKAQYKKIESNGWKDLKREKKQHNMKQNVESTCQWR